MSNLKDVTYCGLYCKLCAAKSRIPSFATSLRDTMRNDGWEHFGEHAMPDFKPFWSTLNQLAVHDKKSPDCRGGCGNPGCSIRNCAKERKVDLCPLCTDYPCQHIQSMAQRYPNLIADGQRLKEIGVELWVEEQNERGKNDFSYCDIRFPQKR